MKSLMFLGAFTLSAFLAAAPACATTIDFEAQAANRGGNLTGIPDSPLNIGIATFTGGELLNGEAGLNADQTGVYATEGLFGSGETNPLVITFAAPVRDLNLFVLNGGAAANYTVADDLGDSVTHSLAPAGSLGGGPFTLPGSGLTTVTITSSDADAWDFAIDRVTFTEATATPVPEPRSMLLAGMSLLILIASAARKRIGARLRESA